MRNLLSGPLFLLALLAAMLVAYPSGAAADQTPGSLDIIGRDGQIIGACPLRHTAVKAEISGFVTRVTVTQQFENTQSNAIEAIYVFPLPQEAAVFEMNLRVGAREVRGVVRRREEAQQIYQQAIAAGHTAALLDQERPNIFTQSVGNIPPGEKVSVTISYFEVLRYKAGVYEFVFPMVVGPRYIPGSPTGAQRTRGRVNDTTQVPDASRITPPVAVGRRAGHDISLEVTLDAGVPVNLVESRTHGIVLERTSASGARVRLRNEATIPNRDFILRYDASGGQIQEAVLAHREGSGPGYFALVLQPPDRVRAEEVTPREIVFVLDTSGSMHGFPIEKAKKVMDLALANLNPQDTFNLITFAGDTHVLFPEPVYPTAENLERARQFLQSRHGGGGTEMMKAIRAALEPSDSQRHMRVVCFMTDGYVGNDMQIIGEVQKYPNARVFSFGIGSSVNRFLLDGMAQAGRGEVEYVGLRDDGDAAARRFYERVRMPLLTDVSLEWRGVAVSDVYPNSHPDLFAAKPLVILGRYNASGHGEVTVRGMQAGRAWKRTVTVHFPGRNAAHEAIGKLWARSRIGELTMREMRNQRTGEAGGSLREQITQLGLEHELMTQYTSFVAVETRTVVRDGRPQRIEVPVELPAGVSSLAVGQNEVNVMAASAPPYPVAKSMGNRSGGVVARDSLSAAGGTGGGVGSGAGSGVGGATMSAQTANSPAAVDSARRDRKAEENEQRRRTALAKKASPQLLTLLECAGGAAGGCPQQQQGCAVQVTVKLGGSDARFATLVKKLGGLVLSGSGQEYELLLRRERLEELAANEGVRSITLGSARIPPGAEQQVCR